MDAASDDFFSDTAMIGISCALPGHTFCHIINRSFDFNFTRQPETDVEYRTSKEEVYYFSLYIFEEPLSTNKHLLYKLKSEKNTLLPEIKQLDFLWMIQCQDAEKEAAKFTYLLRSISQIQLAQVIASDRLKNINHLLI